MKKGNTVLCGYYFFYFAAQACIGSSLNVYLEQVLGLNGRGLGIFNGLTALAPVLVLPVIGWWADRSGRSGWLLTGALVALLTTASFMAVQSTLIGIVAWGMGWEIARSSCVALADKGTIELRGDGYGWLRGFGSLGFLTGGFAIGYLARRWGMNRVLFPVYLGLAALALVCSRAFRQKAKKPRQTLGLARCVKLFSLPGFWLSLLLGAVGSVAVSALQPYLGNHMVVAMGASESLLSWNTLFCVIPELVLLPLFSGRLIPQWGHRICFLITTLGLTIRCLIYALASTPAEFLAGSLFYGLNVCGYTAVNLAYLRRIAPEDLYSTAVLVSAATSALARAGFGWLFGVMYQYLGSRSIFWLIFAGSVGVALLLWRLKDPDPVPPGSDRCR